MHISGCQECTLTVKSTQNLYTCTKCTTGLYLYSNQTSILGSQTKFTACVQECGAIARHVVNDQVRRQCRSCGENCLKCDPLVGCLMCDTGSNRKYFKSEALSTIEPSQKFKICLPCSDLTYKLGFPCKTCTQANPEADPTCTDTYAHLTTLSATGKYFPSSSTKISQCRVENPPFTSPTCGYCSSPHASGKVVGETQCSKHCESKCQECHTLCAGTANNCTYCSQCKSGTYPTTTGSFTKSSVSYSGVSGCSECDVADNLMNKVCAACDGLNKCLKCVAPYVAVKKSFQQDGKNYYECDSQICPSGFFPLITWSGNSAEMYKTCTECDASCQDCYGSGNNQCMSCKAGKYLDVSTSTCKDKDSTPQIIDIVVSHTNKTSLHLEDGSILKPFSDLLRAIAHAEQMAAKSNEAHFILHLTNKPHYIIPIHRNIYLAQSQIKYHDPDNIKIKIQIHPLQCGSQLQGTTIIAQTHDCMASTTEKVTIFNKMGGYLHFWVSKEFKLERVTIDSTSSIVFINNDACYKKKAECCRLDPTSWEPQSVGVVDCTMPAKSTNDMLVGGRPMFEFRRTPESTKTTIGTLYLRESQISGIVYPIQSIIYLQSNYGHISILRSIFKQFHTSGVIITNVGMATHPVTEFEGTSIQSQIGKYIQYRAMRLRVVEQTNSYMVTGCNAISSPCSSIEITQSTFNDLYYTKHFINKYQKTPIGTMGKVILLNSYKSNVKLLSNTLRSNTIYLKDCSVAKSQTSQTSLYPEMIDYHNTLIHLKAHQGILEIINNTFTLNAGHSVSMVNIDHKSNTVTIIDNNTFTQNSGVHSTSLIKVLDTNDCAYLNLRNNIFKNNIGCKDITNAHMVSLVCNDLAAVRAKNIVAGEGTLPSGVKYDKKGILLAGNTFEENFYNVVPLLKIQSYDLIKVSDLKMINNGGSIFLQAANLYSQFKSTMQTYTTHFLPFDSHTGQTASILLYFDKIQETQLTNTIINHFWDLTAVADINKQSIMIYFNLNENSKLTISKFTTDSLLGLTKFLLQKFIAATIEESDLYLDIPNFKLRRGMVGPFFVFNYASTLGIVEIDNLHIPQVKLFHLASGFTWQESFLFREDGAKTVDSFTMKHTKIAKIDCNLCSSSVLALYHLQQKSVYTFENFTIQNYGRSRTARASKSAIQFKPQMTSWTAPYPTVILKQLLCSHAYSEIAGCIIFHFAVPLVSAMTPENVQISNSTFEYSYSEIGAIYYDEGVYGFRSTYENCTWSYCEESKAKYGGDLNLEDVLSPNASISFNQCRFIGSKAKPGGRPKSLTFLSNSVSTFVITNTLFDCKESFPKSDPKELANYYTTTPSSSLQYTMIFVRRSVLEMENVTFQNCHNMRYGVLYPFSATISKAKNIRIKNVSSLQGCGANFLSLVNSAVLDDWIVENCVANQGSGIWVSTGTVVVKNSIFRNNHASLGAGIYSLGSNGITVTNCTFQNNTAFDGGSVLFMLLAQSKSNIFSNVTFIKNKALKGSSIQTTYTDMQISNSKFQDNKANEESFGLDVTQSKVSITNCTFDMDTGQTLGAATGGYITLKVGAHVILDNSTMSNGKATQGGAINGEGEYRLEVDKCRFTNNQANQDGGTMFFNQKKTIIIKNTLILNSKTLIESSGTAIYCFLNVDLTLTNVTIQFQNTNTYIQAVYLQNSKLVGDRVTIDAQWNSQFNPTQSLIPYGGGVSAENPIVFDLKNSVVRNIKYVKNGGGVSIIRNKQVDGVVPTISMNNVTVQSCIALNQGGGLYLQDNLKATMSNIHIIHNFASKEGGGISFINDPQQTLTSDIQISSDSVINNNTASVAGGGVFWNSYSFKSLPPVSGNKGSLYGDNYASYAQQIIVINETQYLQNKQRRLTVTQNIAAQNTVFSDLHSGGVLSSVYLALVDSKGQLISTDSSSFCTISLTPGQTYTYGVAIKGTATSLAVNGIFHFSGLIVIADPGKSFNFDFTTNGIDPSKPDNKHVKQAQEPLKVQFQIDQCKQGEQFRVDGGCSVCEKDVQYLLIKPTVPTLCKQCVTAQMVCFGGDKITPADGYWRSSSSSESFIKCLNIKNCLATTEKDYNPMGVCRKSYTGILCSECELGYSRASGFVCNKCPSLFLNLLRMLGLTVFGGVFMVYFIITTIRRSATKNLQVAYYKILMNHIQLTALISTFKYDWPDELAVHFTIFKFGAEFTSQALNVECIFRDMFKSNNSEQNNYYFIVNTMYAISPIISFIFSFVMWSIIYIKANTPDLKIMRRGRIYSTIFILLFLVHPTIVNKLLDSFICINIDGTERIISKISTQCYSASHLRWILLVNIPGLIIWGMGIPLLSALLLTKHRKILDEKRVMAKYGFLYNGYKNKFYYWETLIMIRKIVMIVVFVSLQQQEALDKSLLTFLVVLSFLYLNKAYEPYMTGPLNLLENMSLTATFLTAYAGIYFLSDIKSYENVNQQENVFKFDFTSLLFIMFIIFGSNIIFIVYWCKKIFEDRVVWIKKTFPKIYMIIFFCGRKESYERQKKEQEAKKMKQEFKDMLKSLREISKIKDFRFDLDGMLLLKQDLDEDDLLVLLKEKKNRVDINEDLVERPNQPKKGDDGGRAKRKKGRKKKGKVKKTETVHPSQDERDLTVIEPSSDQLMLDDQNRLPPINRNVVKKGEARNYIDSSLDAFNKKEEKQQQKYTKMGNLRSMILNRMDNSAREEVGDAISSDRSLINNVFRKSKMLKAKKKEQQEKDNDKQEVNLRKKTKKRKKKKAITGKYVKNKDKTTTAVKDEVDDFDLDHIEF